MNEELLQRAEDIWNQDERIARLGSHFRLYAPGDTKKVFEAMQELNEEIPEITNPSNSEEIQEAELRRRIQSRLIQLESWLEGKPYTIGNVKRFFGLEEADLDELEPWLKENKSAAIKALEELFGSTEIESHELELYTDIPRVRMESEGLAATQIARYHRKLSALFSNLTDIGEYLYRISPEPTTSDYSYYASWSKTLAVSIACILYQEEDGSIQLRERELIRLFGHEGMGHGMQDIITSAADLPFFLKKPASITVPVSESIALHYEKTIFEDLLHAPDVLAELKIKDRFPEIYREEKNTRLINEYSKRLFHFGILVWADKELGDPESPEAIKRKIELIGEHAINPSYAREFVEGNRRKYDSEGNLDFKLASELKYSSEAVKRALKAFSLGGISYDDRQGRNLVDSTFLTGFHSSLGFAQKTDLATRK